MLEKGTIGSLLFSFVVRRRAGLLGSTLVCAAYFTFILTASHYLHHGHTYLSTVLATRQREPANRYSNSSMILPGHGSQYSFTRMRRSLTCEGCLLLYHYYYSHDSLPKTNGCHLHCWPLLFVYCFTSHSA